MSTNARRHDEQASSNIMTTTAQTLSAHTKRQQPLLYPADADPIISSKEKMASAGQGPARKVDKQSPEYLLKSGLAGGLAGCAVRFTEHSGNVYVN
jgi:solute carrier family 25 protein 16